MPRKKTTSHTTALVLDEKIEEALRDNTLVVFAGAGVSMGPPSNYPSFDGLAQEVADWTSETRKKNEPIERFFGRLADAGSKVHDEVARRLSSCESYPRDLHRDLLRLFTDPQQVRIVTTNFDSHFETAAKEIFPEAALEVFRAPALPLGNDFSGIVYLHGSVLAYPKRMVLTDKDFGRAYLTEAWATRFLLSLFSNHTVLFVGYSHNDPVMDYLSRGLPPGNTKPRFALVREKDDLEKWKFRGIAPLSFKSRGKSDFAGLDQAIATWADWVNMGALDAAQSIKEIVSNPTEPSLEGTQFLLRAIKDSVMLRFFTVHAQDPFWFKWLSEKGLLNTLFQRENLSPEHGRLAVWVADSFAVQHREAVITEIAKHGGKVNGYLCKSIYERLALSRAEPDRETLSRWIPLLIQGDLKAAAISHCELLERALETEALPAAILLVEYLTRPYLVVNPPFELDEYDSTNTKARMKLDYQGDYDHLHDVWEKKLMPRLGEVAIRLWPALIQNLSLAYQLRSAWDDGGFDFLSVHRSAIASHPQDRFPTMVDLLVDGIRDCLEWADAKEPKLAGAWIAALAAMEKALFRRLAIHGVTCAHFFDPDKKLLWLTGKNLIGDFDMEVEVWALLQKAYKDANRHTRSVFITGALDEIDIRFRDDYQDATRVLRAQYDFLVNLSKIDFQCPEVAIRIEKAKTEHPELESRKTAPMGQPIAIQSWEGERSPVTVDTLLKKTPAEWFDFFLSFKGDSFAGPDRDGLLADIREAVKSDFKWGMDLVALLRNHSDPPPDLWRSVIRGWVGTSFSNDQWHDILGILNDPILVKNHADAIADLLEAGIKKEEGGIALSHWELADKLAGFAWDNIIDEDEAGPIDFNRALNRAGGRLALFWLYGLSRYRQQAAGQEGGLLLSFKSRFEIILSAGTPAGTFGRVILASQANFLYRVDQNWTRTNLIPLFDWDRDQQRAYQAWQGWLHWGDLRKPLFDELMPSYRKLFPDFANNTGGLRERFIEHVAFAALHLIEDPLSDKWLIEFLKPSEDRDRTELARRMPLFLDRMKPEAVKTIWNRWLKRYWERRLSGVPVPLCDGEVREMARRIDVFEPVFPEAVDLICQGPVPHMDEFMLFHRLAGEKQKIAEQHPAAMAKFLVHLTSDRQMPGYLCKYLEPLTEKLIDARANRPLLKKLCNQLAAIGCNHAGELYNRIDSTA